MKRGVADKPDANLHARCDNSIAIAQAHFHLQLLGLFVEEQDAEGAVVDQATCETRDASKQLVQIENGSELPDDFSERLERGGVLPLVVEEARILDRDGNVRGELP